MLKKILYGVLCVLFFLILLRACGAITYPEHTWQPATCTEPRICTTCKAEDGEPLGHDWGAATCSAYQTCQRCGATGGQRLEHTWVDATCTEPEHCAVCGEKRHWYSLPLSHDWIDATCTEPKTCSRCGATEGEPQHFFVSYYWETVTEPTCQTEGLATHSCEFCEATETKVLPIVECKADGWTIIQEATAAVPGIRAHICTMCGREIEREEYAYLPLSDGGSSDNGNNFNTYNNEDQQNTSANYVLNTSSHVFHRPSCRDVPKISPENYSTTNRTRSDLIESGWRACGHCSP